MASAKATFSFLVLIVVLVVLGVGGAYCFQLYQGYAVKKDIKSAEIALNEKRPRDAEQLLASRLEKASPGTNWAPEAIALRFRALEAMPDAQTATALAAKVLDGDHPWVRPGDDAWAKAHLILANTALENRLADQAQQHLQAVLSQPPRGPNDPILSEAQFNMARIELATPGKAESGREKLVALQEALPEASPLKPRVEKVLGDINTRMLFNLQPYGRDQIHILAKGDSLDKLSKQYKVSADLLMGINQINDPRRLRIGRRLKIPDLQLSLVVDKSNNTLTVYNYGKFFKRYTVRTGTDEYKTPVGEFSILNKAKDPVWYNQKEGRKIPANDPANELGSRWMGFQGTSLGIHEARDPQSLGKYSSNGCVGLAREDVQELFNMVSVGTPLKIQGQLNPALLDKTQTAGTFDTTGNPSSSATPSPAAGAAASTPLPSPQPGVNPLTPAGAAPADSAVLPENGEATAAEPEAATPTPAARTRRNARGKRAPAGAPGAPAAPDTASQPAFGQ